MDKKQQTIETAIQEAQPHAEKIYKVLLDESSSTHTLTESELFEEMRFVAQLWQTLSINGTGEHCILQSGIYHLTWNGIMQTFDDKNRNDRIQRINECLYNRFNDEANCEIVMENDEKVMRANIMRAIGWNISHLANIVSETKDY